MMPAFWTKAPLNRYREEIEVGVRAEIIMRRSINSMRSMAKRECAMWKFMMTKRAT